MCIRDRYGQALEYAGLTGEETVWDLYCGIGTISLFLAQKAKKVYGVEIVPEAIADAKENAVRNGITNTEFYVGKAEEVLPRKYEADGVYAVSYTHLDVYKRQIYDCSYKAADDIYEISSVDSYDKSIIVFMKDGEKGWELKKESVLQVSFYMDGEFAGQPMGVGLIHDMKYDDPIVCEGISNDGDTLSLIHI